MVTKPLLTESTLAVNIGNDTVCIGIFNQGGLIWTRAFSTPQSITVDEAEDIVDAALHARGCPFADSGADRFQGAIVASVVPYLTDAWVQAARRISIGRPLVVGPGLKTGLKMNYNDPAEIGADRIANLAAACKRYNNPLIVVDLGVTTNFSVVNSEGVFCGGIIAPGLRISAEALSDRAARLYSVEIKAPSAIIGKSTKAAMQSGIIMGEVTRIDGLIESMWGELGYETEVIATGTHVSEIASLCRHVGHVEENLTMQGLGILYSLNRPSSGESGRSSH